MKTFKRLALAATLSMIAALMGVPVPATATTSDVSGTITNSSGTSIGDGVIYFFASCADYVAFKPAASNSYFANGYYGLSVADGTYLARIYPHGYDSAFSWHPAKARCSEAQPITVSGPTTVDLVARDGVLVTGTVTGTGPMTSGELHFYASCQDFTTSDDAGYASVTDGDFSTTLAPGDYLVSIDGFMGSGALDSWHRATSTCGAATSVSVPPAGTLDLTALPGNDVGGTVSSSNGEVDAGEVLFYAKCEDITDAKWAARVPIVDGEYVVTVPDGTYRVQIFAGGDAVSNSWHNAKLACEEADPITVTGPLDLDLVAVSRSTVTGGVSSAAGQVASGRVYFYDDCAGPYLRSRTFTDGKYEVVIPNGTYRVRIEPRASSGAADSWHSAKADCQQADVVTIQGDTVLNLVAMVYTPPPPAPPPVTRVAQTVKAPPAKLKVGKSRKLAKTTRQGITTTWKSLSKRACKVAKFKVTGLRKRQCRLKVTAPQTAAYQPLSQLFLIAIK